MNHFLKLLNYVHILLFDNLYLYLFNKQFLSENPQTHARTLTGLSALFPSTPLEFRQNIRLLLLGCAGCT
jgi:hypothetical protein